MDMDVSPAAIAAVGKAENQSGAMPFQEDKLRTFIRDEFCKQADLLQELSSQIKSAVERDLRVHGHSLREFSFAHRPSPRAKKAPAAGGDDAGVDDSEARAKSDKKDLQQKPNKLFEPGGLPDRR